MYSAKLKAIHAFILTISIICGIGFGYYLHYYLEMNNKGVQIDIKEYQGMNENDDQMKTLKFVAVIFRHGERIPELQTDYPTNPHKNHSYFPYNYGDLIEKGQVTLIKTGLRMKRRYQSFLGNRYYNGLTRSISSSFIRCQISLQAFHAGLFWTEDWNVVPNLPWQPVPYQILREEEDYISVIKMCPRSFGDTINPEVNETTQALFDYIEQHSGFTNVSFYRAMTMYDITKINLDNDLPPPPWVQSIYPEPLKSIGLQFWRLFAEQNQRICSGSIFMNMIEHVKLLAAGESNAKMMLFSAHEITIVNVLTALNAWRCDDVEFGAALLLELHEIDNVLGFKIYYDNNHIEQIPIPSCATFCPLSEFEKIMEPLYKPTPYCN